jgi:hypothetical protein
VPAVRDRTVHLVKVDTQGRDHRALAGMRAVLLRDRPHVLTEFWPGGIRESGDEPDAVLARYRGWGYRLCLLCGSGTTECPDDELIGLAEESDEGFVTLWLQPNGGSAHRVRL